MIDHCYAVSGEINPLFFISSLLSLNLCLLLLCIYFLKKQNQIKHILNLVIFNLKKLDYNTYAVLEVRHPLCSLILQGFVLLRVVIYY
jgi:hypothetical protein